MKKLLCGIIGTAGLAASASAAVSWQTQMQFVRSTGPAGSPAGTISANGTYNTSVTGTYTFTVQAGIFNFTDTNTADANHGLFNWTSTANASGLAGGDTLGVNNASSRSSPFTFGPATSFGGTLTGPSQITNINAARDVSGGASAAWLWDSNLSQPGPTPTSPTSPAGDVGVNGFNNVWRFQVVIGTNATHDIVINFQGSAGPVIRWEQFGSNPPDDSTNGTVTFLGITRSNAEGGPLDPYASTNLTIHITPAPGSLALLGLGGLIAARRRRS